MVEKYEPSNGTEGEIFYDMWCASCERDRCHREDQDAPGCMILMRSMTYSATDAEYPVEWQGSSLDDARCTAYVPAGALIQERCARTLDMFEAPCN